MMAGVDVEKAGSGEATAIIQEKKDVTPDQGW